MTYACWGKLVEGVSFAGVLIGHWNTGFRGRRVTRFRRLRTDKSVIQELVEGTMLGLTKVQLSARVYEKKHGADIPQS